MNIDFAFWLTMAVLFTGVVWLADVLYFRSRREEDQKPNIILDFGVSFFPVLLIVFVLRSFLFEPFQIPSGSMRPTLEVGDFIVVNKFSYGLRLPVLGTKILPIGEPKRGDVMVFFPPNDDRYFIKRVIGLPGDTIEMENNVLKVNGEIIEHQFITSLPVTDRRDESHAIRLYNEELEGVVHGIRTLTPIRNPLANGKWIVRDNHYFMIGDNRDDSTDSRFWGQVPEENIVGKAVAVWMHWESVSSLPSFGRAGRIE